MPSLDSLQAVAELGALGAVLFIVIRLWVGTGKELKASQESRISEERQHGKEMLALERHHSKQMTEVATQQDKTLMAVESTMEAVSEKLDELIGE